jgi:GNAT superfamily N-acetyltransferase
MMKEGGEARVRSARPDDVVAMAALAEMKREQYRHNASPFQVPAVDARSVHEAFLARLVSWDGFLVAVHDGQNGVDGFIVAGVGSAPPPFGEGALFHVDDFVVATPSLWTTVGRALLEFVAGEATSAGATKAIVVSGSRAVDAPKVDFLAGLGLLCEAEWWVKQIEPAKGESVATNGFEASVGPAPPVYKPGGPTCLASRVESPTALPALERFAAASEAVIVIVPTFASRDDLRGELRNRGYAVASEWYTGTRLA